MEEYYNSTLKEFINAVLDGQEIYYIINDTMIKSQSKDVKYGIIDMKYPYEFNNSNTLELDYVLHKNNVTLDEFTRFNNLLKFLEVQNIFASLKPNIKRELKLEDRDITEDDLDYFYLPELNTLYLKR